MLYHFAIYVSEFLHKKLAASSSSISKFGVLFCLQLKQGIKTVRWTVNPISLCSSNLIFRTIIHKSPKIRTYMNFPGQTSY